MSKCFRVFLLLVMIHLSNTTHACSMIFYSYHYQIQNHEVVYTEVSSIKSIPKVIKKLKGVNPNQFGPVFTPKKENESEQGWRDNGYFADKKNIFWKGEKITIPSDQPQIDIASFQQASQNATKIADSTYSRQINQVSALATDKNSIYFLGQRTDDNTGSKTVDLHNLKQVDEYMMSDGKSLYSEGKYRGNAKGFREIKKSRYGSPGVSCEFGYFIIAANDNNIFIDGKVLPEVDAETFKIKRWMPNLLLDYTDKNGDHTYAYGKTTEELNKALSNFTFFQKGFHFTRDKVVYVTKEGRYGEKQQEKYIIPIPGLDPENVKKISIRSILSQDGQTLYVLEGDIDSYYGKKDLTLRTIHLKNKNAKFFNMLPGNIIDDTTHLYIINDRRGLFSFKKSGEFIFLGDHFGRDDEYVYILGEGKRFKTAKPKEVKLNSIYKLITAEGYYDTHGRLHP